MQVRIYRNLHKQCYSVQRKVEGRWLVCWHAKTVILTGATFIVNQKGRERVLSTGHKNVHAYIYGEHVASMVDGVGQPRGEFVTVFYNPRLLTTFCTVRGPIDTASTVIATEQDGRSSIYAAR